MSWTEIMIAIKRGIVASAESVANIVSGATKVGDADKLDNYHASDFVLSETAKASGLFADMLGTTKITADYTIMNLLNKQSVTFFTNWSDNMNFPSLYGSGVMLPALDSTNRYIYYGSGTEMYYAYAKNTSGTWVLTWKKLSDADTVDGKHATSFLLSNGGFQGFNSVADLNEFHTGVGLFSESIANVPSSAWWLIISGGDSNTRTQIAFSLFNDIPAKMRYCASKTWSAWSNINVGMSAKVVVSTTAPADTTAVWIVPN